MRPRLALIRDMVSHPGDKLQIIHRLLLRALTGSIFMYLVANLNPNA